MSESLIRLCAVSDVPANSVKAVETEGNVLAVYNLDGTFYATDDACTHGAASLSDGYLDGEAIECFLHAGSFHIPSGKVKAPPCFVPLRTYKVVVRDDAVFVDLTREADAAG